LLEEDHFPTSNCTNHHSLYYCWTW